jgi:hypothetical protein
MQKMLLNTRHVIPVLLVVLQVVVVLHAAPTGVGEASQHASKSPGSPPKPSGGTHDHVAAHAALEGSTRDKGNGDHYSSRRSNIHAMEDRW